MISRLKNNMEHQDKIALIRQKAIKANPEIVELKFGCKVLLNIRKWESQLITNEIGWRGNDKTQFQGQDIEFWNDDIREIIGRPVRLADVLLAIEETKPGFLVVAKNGRMTQITNEFADILRGWTWAKDDLSLQDEPTINFLYEILK